MNKLFSAPLFLFFAVFLSACSNTKNIPAFNPQAAKAGHAVVYIYRPDSMSNAMYSPGLTIDGEFKFYVKNGSNTRLSLSPGKHVFAFQREKKYSELKPLSLIYKTGTVYFIRVNTSLEINQTTSYEPYVRNFRLIAIDKAQAVIEIAECCTDGSDRPASREKAPASPKESTDGFSVDKTQNPFSH